MKLGKTQQIPEAACIGCGCKTNAATPIGADNAFPQAGDATVCLQCGHIMVYNADLSLRDPIDKEMHAIAGDPRIVSFNKVRLRSKSK